MVQVEEAQEFKLHPPLVILLASLLGGPLAGGVLLAQNYRYGRGGGGGGAVAFGIVLLSLAAMAGYVMLLAWAPTTALRCAVVAGQAIVMYILGSVLVGWILSRAGMDDLPPAPSVVLVVLFSLVCLGVVVGGYMGAARVMGSAGGDSGLRRMAINPHADIVYWGASEQPAAQTISAAIQDQALFSVGTNYLVTLGHDAAGHHTVAVVAPKEQMADPQDAQSKLQKLSDAIHGAFPGGITLRMLDGGFVEQAHLEAN